MGDFDYEYEQCQGCIRAGGGEGCVAICWKLGRELKPEDPCPKEEPLHREEKKEE